MDIAALKAKASATPIPQDEPRPEIPDMVPGRVLFLDGDGAAYNCSGNDDTALTTAKSNMRKFAENKRQESGSEYVIVTMTGGDGTKGGRYDIATVKPYQSNRSNKVKPKNLSALREWMLFEWVGTAPLIKTQQEIANIVASPTPLRVLETSEEADDLMTQLNEETGKVLGFNFGCVCSEDKDLFMNQGNFLDFNTGEMTFTDNAYGEAYTRYTPSGTAKLGGKGHAIFFHQMLMGDTADTIPGLPEVGVCATHLYFPDAPLLKAADTLLSDEPISDKKYNAAHEKFSKLLLRRRSIKCGLGKAMSLLKDCKTSAEAFDIVLECYASYYSKNAARMLTEQARLLWMRRTYGEDVLVYFHEIKKGK